MTCRIQCVVNRLQQQAVALRTPMLAVALFLCTHAAFAQDDQQVATDGDVMAGWRIFNDKQCVDCHAIWSQGGRVGPDLGRIQTGILTGGQLAGIMWNHIPKMLGRMEEAGLPPTVLSESEMADLFALVYFVRQLDETGDPVRGLEILRRKGCVQCHSINVPGGGIGPDLARWGAYANPVIWAQMMWEHAPVMEQAMERSGITWPELEGSDLVHIISYIRSAGVSGPKTYLRPGSAQLGQRLFQEKKCDQCHPGSGPDLSQVQLPTSIGALASRMWNHSPQMTRHMQEQDVDRISISPQELGDILTYVLKLASQDRSGDPTHGREVFALKGCNQCHEAEDVSQTDVPALGQLSAYAEPVMMASAMWNHGQTMLEKMTAAGLSWPIFHDDEMIDLLAYLRSLQEDQQEQAGGN